MQNQVQDNRKQMEKGTEQREGAEDVLSKLQKMARRTPVPSRPRGSWHNGWGHFLTITHHKLLVMYYCFQVGLYKQGLLHDLSKYTPMEFRTGIRYYQGFKSPNSAERDDRGYSAAWLHHKGRNKHHFEYWIDVRGKGDGTLVGMPMPTRYVVEMFCDRIAACKVYLKEKYTDRSPLEYYERNVNYVTIHPDSAALLVCMLKLLAEKGEKEAFRIVRTRIVKPRYRAGDQGTF